MKLALAVAMSSIAFGLFACSASSSPSPDDFVDGDEDNLTASLGAKDALKCDAGDGKAKLALVAGKDNKVTLVTFTPGSNLYTLGSTTGALEASTSKWSWKGASASLDVGANMKGTFKQGSKTTDVTCKRASTADAPSWRTAAALVSYASDIDGLASTVTEEMSASDPKPYNVFAVETSKRSALDLGTKATNSAGALPGDDGVERLDENDNSYAGLSAAYGLGGGDDYGEWFQGASDGISLTGSIGDALGSAKAGFIAHEKCVALAPLVDSAQPSAIELTVGGWTFLLPDAFSK